jgi:hypothetical protein
MEKTAADASELLRELARKARILAAKLEEPARSGVNSYANELDAKANELEGRSSQS